MKPKQKRIELDAKRRIRKFEAIKRILAKNEEVKLLLKFLDQEICYEKSKLAPAA